MALLQLQMTWQPLLKKRKNGPPLGLKNLGNTCYLNSVLQCLTYTPPLANFCLKHQHSSLCDLAATERDKKSECPFCLLERRIFRSLSVDLTLDQPGKIISSLRIFAEHFRFGRQEDAHEFLRYVIDACHTSCLRLKKLHLQKQQQKRKVISNGGGVGGEGLGGNTVVKEIFGGALQSQVKCLGCGTESNKVDEIMDISLDVLHSSSLKEAFQKFFQPETLDGSNKYKCDNCKKLVAARKQMSILQAPNVLVIQLKRFEGILGGKIDKAIAFEEVLVLSSFMCKASKDPHPEYNLFATIVHSGFSPDSGHYYAYIKDAVGRWYCCNDSYVTISTPPEVLSEKVYILFFSRTQQRPVSVSKILTANGTKCSVVNGSNTSNVSKAVNDVKSTGSQKGSNHDSLKDNSTPSKADNVLSSPQSALTSSESSGNRKFPETVNGAVNVKIIVHKTESNGTNGNVKASICTSKSEKTTQSGEDANGLREKKLVDTVSNGKRQLLSFPLVKANGKIQKSKADSAKSVCKNHESTNGVLMDKLPSFQEVQNGKIKCHPDNSCPKRKREDEVSCALLPKDAQSRARCEELKEGLKKEASLFLRSCGWSEEVYSFMRSKKQLCAPENGNDALNIEEHKEILVLLSESGQTFFIRTSASFRDCFIRRLLIADAKPTFLPRIPESLKANFIERLKSFSQEQAFAPER